MKKYEELKFEVVFFTEDVVKTSDGGFVTTDPDDVGGDNNKGAGEINW